MLSKSEMVCKYCDKQTTYGVIRMDRTFACYECLEKRSRLSVPKLSEFTA